MQIRDKFSIINASAILDIRLKEEDILVLCVIGSQVGSCDFSPAEIANMLGKKEKSIRASMRRLVSTGHLERLGRSKRSGRGRHMVYRVAAGHVPSIYLRQAEPLSQVA